MNKYLLLAVGPVLAVGAPLLVCAQTSANADRASMGMPLQFESAFADYQPYRDLPAGHWKALNDASAASVESATPPMAHGMRMPMNEGVKAPMPMAHDMATPAPTSTSTQHRQHDGTNEGAPRRDGQRRAPASMTMSMPAERAAPRMTMPPGDNHSMPGARP